MNHTKINLGTNNSLLIQHSSVWLYNLHWLKLETIDSSFSNWKNWYFCNYGMFILLKYFIDPRSQLIKFKWDNVRKVPAYVLNHEIPLIQLQSRFGTVFPKFSNYMSHYLCPSKGRTHIFSSTPLSQRNIGSKNILKKWAIFFYCSTFVIRKCQASVVKIVYCSFEISRWLDASAVVDILLNWCVFSRVLQTSLLVRMRLGHASNQHKTH